MAHFLNRDIFRSFASYLQSPLEDLGKRIIIMRITCFAFLVTLVLSWRGYIHDLRVFSLAPVIKILAQTSSTLEWGFFALHLTALGWLLLQPLKRLPAICVLLLTAFWSLQDLMRFQPYIYMYFFTILFTVFFKAKSLNALKIMVGSVYFWAGFHKLNMTFYFSTFPWFISPLYKFSNEASILNAVIFCIALSVPIFEAAIGVLLLFFPTKWKIASLMAFIMTLIVLTCLGPFGHGLNIIAWPWNIYLLLIELILFYKPSFNNNGPLFQYNVPVLISTILFSLTPALTAIGLWPSFPGFAIYSGNIKYAEVFFSDKELLAHLPNDISPLISSDRKLSVFKWTANEFNIAPYPEIYVFKRGAQGLCPYLSDKQGARLRIHMASPFYSVTSQYKDYPLCPDQPAMCKIDFNRTK